MSCVNDTRYPRSSVLIRGSLRKLIRGVWMVLVAGCVSGPQPIAYGADACDYCRMQISDRRYGAEIVTKTGKVNRFDSIECLTEFYRQAIRAGDLASVWVADYRHPGTLIPATTARYLDLGAGHSPMGRGLIAVAADSDARALQATLPGAVKAWSEIIAPRTTAESPR
jgi:copper chaperone NosL